MIKPFIFSRASLVLSGILVCLVANGCANTAPVPEPPKPEAPATSAAPEAPKAAKSLKIDINTAPIPELDKLELPGTKPSLSERIQGGRPYKQIDDLVTKKVISAEEFKLIQNLVTTETKK